MSMNARNYRDYLYENGAHPPQPGTVPVGEAKGGLSGLLLTIPPFLVAEYFCELRYETLPSGLAFPLAYVLFWAFYYTYYKPDVLEKHLTGSKKWDGLNIPTVLLGAVVWFVKVVVVELADVILLRWFLGVPAKKKEQATRRAHRPRAASGFSNAGPRPANVPGNDLPREVENALAILGLTGCRDWNLIQKRYRELAKKFHPDLNQEITQVGNRFMLYDAAYRRLENVKTRYFSPRQ
jgi:hypothetical protein